MSEPVVSIVLPTYNGSRYLAESIDSCLAQTLPDWELIVVDDCSTDATPAIIADYVARDARIRSVRHERNRRLPGGLNTGMSLALGRYLTWTSDDNRYLPEAIAQMVAELEREPNIGLVYAPMEYIDAHGRVLGPAYSGGPPDHLAFGSPVGGCFLYRREVYQTIGEYDADLFLVEDWDYWIRVAGKFRLKALSQELYQFRLHDESLSRQRQDKFCRASRKLLERHLPEMNWLSPSARARGYLLAARQAWRIGDRRDALRHIGRAFRFSPMYSLRRLLEEPIDRVLKRRSFRRRLPAAESGHVHQVTINPHAAGE
jgi:glycosyltransferase involved in cell wall biosynthesis